MSGLIMYKRLNRRLWVWVYIWNIKIFVLLNNYFVTAKKKTNIFYFYSFMSELTFAKYISPTNMVIILLIFLW